MIWFRLLFSETPTRSLALARTQDHFSLKLVLLNTLTDVAECPMLRLWFSIHRKQFREWDVAVYIYMKPLSLQKKKKKQKYDNDHSASITLMKSFIFFFAEIKMSWKPKEERRNAKVGEFVFHRVQRLPRHTGDAAMFVNKLFLSTNKTQFPNTVDG